MKKILIALVALLPLVASGYDLKEAETNYDLCLDFEEFNSNNPHITIEECDSRWIPLYEHYENTGSLSSFKTDAEKKKEKEIQSNAIAKNILVSGIVINLKKKYWDNYIKFFNDVSHIEGSKYDYINGHQYSFKKTQFSEYMGGINGIMEKMGWDIYSTIGTVPAFSRQNISITITEDAFNTGVKQTLQMTPYFDAKNFGLKDVDSEAMGELKFLFRSLFVVLKMKTDKNKLMESGKYRLRGKTININYPYPLKYPSMFKTRSKSLKQAETRFGMYCGFLNGGLADPIDEFSIILYSIIRDFQRTDMNSVDQAKKLYTRSIEKLNNIQISVGRKQIGFGDFTNVLHEEYTEYENENEKAAKAKVKRDAYRVWLSNNPGAFESTYRDIVEDIIDDMKDEWKVKHPEKDRNDLILHIVSSEMKNHKLGKDHDDYLTWRHESYKNGNYKSRGVSFSEYKRKLAKGEI